MNNNLITTKRGVIEFSIRGMGKPILFVHGGHSNCNETLCYKGFDLLKHMVIIPSRPGYGKTPLNNNKSAIQTADLFVSLLDYLNLDKVIVYGISAGGLTAIELAANYPERVEKLILASAVSKKWLDQKGKIYKTASKLFNPNVEFFVWSLIRFFSAMLPALIAKKFYPQFTTNPLHKLNKEDVKELISTLKHFRSKKGFINDIKQNIDDNIISEIVCPSLIIHSINDNSVPFEHASHANKTIKQSVLVKLNNQWGHLFWIGADSTDSIERTLKFIEE
jgi:pimeloyl-ACP methyl ester carboxylesterase